MSTRSYLPHPVPSPSASPARRTPDHRPSARGAGTGTGTRAGAGPRAQGAFVTLAGIDWLASADRFPHRVHTLWAHHPGAPVELPCGSVFDVIDAPVLFGRRMLDRLWSPGAPGSGPVAAHRGRLLLFAAPGTAQRLPALLAWEEWSRTGRSAPSLLYYGTGDAVTVPPPFPAGGEDGPAASRWLVAPEVRRPWLPGADVLLWACLRAAGEGSVPTRPTR
ncbi:bifunctional DNA primase/polymerase [Streptomyces sp. NPDC049555]|uniref:bifunctional DNA primase/polymerase n=1 Tax=Streptomyces sp. NPDC049555 TaxID=3154930 RepID=UPI00342FAE09